MNTDAETIDETLRLRRAFAARSRDAVAAPDCPPAERLWDAARGFADRGESGAGDVRELIEHVAGCGVCAEAWRLARELEPSGGAREQQPAARRWWQQPGWTAVAAAAIVVLALGLSWRQSADRPADGVRGAEPVQLLRIPDNGGRLSRRAPVLRWPATDNATYDLLVMTEDLETTLVEVYGLDSADYRIPDEDLRGVSAGAVFLWRVEINAPGGRSRLPTYKLVLD